MNYKKRIRDAAILTATITVLISLTACGGGGSGDEKSNNGVPIGPKTTDSIPTTTTLPELSGLSNDANQSYRLFYLDASRTTTTGTGIHELEVPDFWLQSYDPASQTTQTVSQDIPFTSIASPSIFPAALRKATVDSQNGKVTNFHITSVAYITGSDDFINNPEKQMMITDVTSGVSKKVAKESLDLSIAMQPIMAMDLNNPEKSQFTARYNEQYFLPMDTPESQAIKMFPQGVNVEVPLHYSKGADAGSPLGWLVVDENQDGCLALVKISNEAQATCILNQSGGDKVKPKQENMSGKYVVGFYPLNDGVVLSLPVENSDTGLQVTTQLWFYKSGNPGTLQLLKNTSDEPLYTKSLTMFGPDQNSFAVSKNGDTLYLAASDGGFMNILAGAGSGSSLSPSSLESHVFLYKIDTTSGSVGWKELYHDGGQYVPDDYSDGVEAVELGSFLADAGNRLIWVINEKLISMDLNGKNFKVLDGRDGDDYHAVARAASSTNWFYYNHEMGQHSYATAIKTDGSERIELKGCSWIGTSTSGTANYVGGSVTTLEPSEVFMQCNQQEISAVDANDPKAGRVILGQLNEKAEEVAMSGTPAPGPHRLIRVKYEKDGSAEEYQVLYANTRLENSLKSLVIAEDDGSNKAGFTAPVHGF